MTQHIKSHLSKAKQADNTCLGAMTALIESFGDWQIRNDILYLDNGAFGSCPTSFVEKQKEIRQRIEENPHEFFERAYVSGLENSRKALAGFLHADPRDIFLLPGATHALNIVIQSLNFNPDDEILTTNVAYSSCRMVMDHVAKREGAHVVVIEVPLLVTGQDDVMQRILAGVTPRTRFAVIDHIPSRTGLVFPAKDIVRELESGGIDTLVDGAHAPGMIPLDLEDINATYYVSNCHKWMCSPRGIGFLHVRCDRAQNLKPLVIARSPYVVGRSKHSALEHSFGWMGTYCPSAMLSLPSAIEHLNTVMPGGYSGLTSRNHDLAILARRIVCKAIGISVPCPDNMIAAMATIPLPDSPHPEQEGMLPIQQALWKEHGIVIPVYVWPSYPKRVIRLSVQAYNTLDQYLKLADCLRIVLHNERASSPFGALSAKSLAWPYGRRHSSDSGYSSSTEGSLACGCGGSGTESSSVKFDGPDTPYKDIESPTPATLIQLAQSRVRRILDGSFKSYPVSLFPTATGSIMQSPLTRENRANLEISRVTYMLSSLPRRRIPQLMSSFVSQLLEADDIIESWPKYMDMFRNQAHILSRAILCDMNAPRTPASFPTDAGEFVSSVVPYETENDEGNLSLTFWLRTLAEFAAKGEWSSSRVISFLQIHSFLKDPVGGLRKCFDTQTDHFILMLKGLESDIDVGKTDRDTWAEVAAQLALESSFMSQRLVSKACYIHFTGDQQLVYSYTDISTLARSEFSCPDIVIGMIEEIIKSEDECSIAPIAVAHSCPIASSHDVRAVIVDGNNRITTLTFLKFVSMYGLTDLKRTEDQLREYCSNSGLGPVFFVDFCTVLQMLRTIAVEILHQLQTCTNLDRFQNISQVPCLVTEEASFFTKVLVNEEENIAQPVHQYIFATDDLLVALPPKMQSHGRAKKLQSFTS
ncbi:Isopenicillin N epimerase [Fusarium austroafricanum]|uniref:Isopenicillin N epimerase n=1 Tax=Fusarium austroafricanum TaxID=2364996 RepID=A0A8H4KXH0_9HYPO|nr:Isopenicillin N epimerase [Fusarium austroafricanum]